MTTTRERVTTGPCVRCTRRTWATGLICRACVVAERRAAQEDIALTDGAWQLDPKRRIQVWVPGGETQTPTPDAGQFIACPTCRARIDEWCTRTTTGQRMAREHRTRLVTRHCACGSAVQRGRKRCADCSLEARRETWREGMRRKRSKEEVAA